MRTSLMKHFNPPAPPGLREQRSALPLAPAAEVTVITAMKPARLSKSFALGPDGTLTKDAGGRLSKGTLEIRQVDGLLGLASLLESLTPAQALTYGIPADPDVKEIVTRKEYECAGRPIGTTSRTNDNFLYSKGPAFLHLDYDPEPGTEPLTREQLHAALLSAVPALAGEAMLWWPSASSAIWHGELELRGIRGQRVWLLVNNGDDIPRAGRVLIDRLWLNGKGNVKVSRSGALLDRTLLDSSVWQASRLDFAGGARCEPPLSQRRGKPFLLPGNQDGIDTRNVFPDLSQDEAHKVDVIKRAARELKQPAAAEARKTWIAARLAECPPADMNANPDEGKERADRFAAIIDSKELPGDFRIHVKLDGKIQAVSVAELLSEPGRFDGVDCLDPLEPEYDDHRLVGKLFLRGKSPVLHSFAHGGATYHLRCDRKRVDLVAGRMSEAVSAVVEGLGKDYMIYDYGEHLALVDAGKLHVLNEHSLQHHLGSRMAFRRQTRAGVVDCDAPPTFVRQILSLKDRRRLKPLEGVITSPSVRIDGSVLDRTGYDRVTRLYVDLPSDSPLVAAEPTLDEARTALSTLTEPFADFPFVTPADRGAHLSALLTAAVRAVLPTAPAFGYDAPVMGSGKTLLASCVVALASGERPDVWPHTQHDEEIRKRLLAALLSGTRAIVWDNVTGSFNSAAMAALLTGSGMTDRVLGQSETRRVPNRMLVTLTGNNLAFAGDLVRRVIVCRIDPKIKEPYTRTFGLDPLEHCLRHRTKMIGAACTLIRAKTVHRPRPVAPGRLASFENWDDLVRQTVMWASHEVEPGAYGDPIELIRQAQLHDPDAEALEVLLHQLQQAFGDGEFSAREILTGGLAGDLAAAIKDLGGDNALSSPRSLGHLLKKHKDQHAGDLRLSARTGPANALVYRIRAA